MQYYIPAESLEGSDSCGPAGFAVDGETIYVSDADSEMIICENGEYVGSAYPGFGFSITPENPSCVFNERLIMPDRTIDINTREETQLTLDIDENEYPERLFSFNDTVYLITESRSQYSRFIDHYKYMLNWDTLMWEYVGESYTYWRSSTDGNDYVTIVPSRRESLEITVSRNMYNSYLGNDSAGNIYVCVRITDEENNFYHMIQRYDSSGCLVSYTTLPVPLDELFGIVGYQYYLEDDGSVYVMGTFEEALIIYKVTL